MIGILFATLAAVSATAGTIVSYPDMKSVYIGSAHVTVWLPPGYDGSQTKYAVLYMQDGQNLFDDESARLGWPAKTAWGVDTTLSALAGRLRPAIVVAVDHLGVRRARQYVPQAVFDRLPEVDRELLKAQYGGTPFSDDYLRFVVKELKPFVDRTYRTDPGPSSTFVMGSSMGGLISLYAIAEYPDVFGGAGCLSTHWPLNAPGQAGPSVEEVAAAFGAYLRQKLRPGHRIWMDHGDTGLDASYAPFQAKIDDLLQSMGWRRGVDYESRSYAGADHNESAWRARLADPLTFLLGPDAARWDH
jgi:enterochelin esterase-like enzyme